MTDKFVLLVEDNPDDEKLSIRAIQKNMQNKVIVAHDGVEAIDFLFCTGAYEQRGSNELPAVVLLDLKLPKLDGLEVLRRLRADERTKRLPIVILTSSREEQDLVSSYGLGANSYIRKPVDFEQFMEVVRQLGLYWLTLNETVCI